MDIFSDVEDKNDTQTKKRKIQDTMLNNRTNKKYSMYANTQDSISLGEHLVASALKIESRNIRRNINECRKKPVADIIFKDFSQSSVNYEYNKEEEESYQRNN